MALELNQIRESLKNPSKRNLIGKAVRHQNRLKFHTETYLDLNEISQPANDFLEWVSKQMVKDKFNTFVSLFRFPTPVIGLTNRMYNELEKVFDARNASTNSQFVDSKLKDDWEWYRQYKLKEPTIWKKKGFKKMKSAINSILVIDLPKEQKTSLPEPYFYWLPIESVLDFDTEHGKFEWLIFHQEDNKVAAICDEWYRVFEIDSKNEIVEGSLIEVKHNIVKDDEKLCPACFFWDDELVSDETSLKSNPLSPQLNNLDKLLFKIISKDHLDSYAAYPIYSVYATNCNFENPENGDVCDGGFLRDTSNKYKIFRDGTVEKCPVCSGKKFAQPGSMVTIPIPNDGKVDPDKYVPDLKDPVKITTIDVESLNYNRDEVTRLQNEIFTSVTGDNSDVQDKQAINLGQVGAIAENKTLILNNLKKNFERAMNFVDEVCCILRYGENFISVSNNLGTEFYNYTVAELYAQYKQAKENGASQSQLDALQKQIIEVENKTNVQQLQRMSVLSQLEPYPNYSFTDLMTLKENNLVDNLLLTIKLNFTTFVDRFERENINVTEFGIQMNFNEKIKTIFEQFKLYANEQKIDKGTVGNPQPTDNKKPITIGNN